MFLGGSCGRVKNRMGSKEVLAFNTSKNYRSVCDHVVREFSFERFSQRYITSLLAPEETMRGKHGRNANGSNGHLVGIATVAEASVYWSLKVCHGECGEGLR